MTFPPFNQIYRKHPFHLFAFCRRWLTKPIRRLSGRHAAVERRKRGGDSECSSSGGVECASEAPSPTAYEIQYPSDFVLPPAVKLAAETVDTVKCVEDKQTEEPAGGEQQPQPLLVQSRQSSRRPSLLPALSALFTGSHGGGSSGARSPINTSPSPTPTPNPNPSPSSVQQQLVGGILPKGSGSGTWNSPVSPCGHCAAIASGTGDRQGPAQTRPSGNGHEKEPEDEVPGSPQRSSSTVAAPDMSSSASASDDKKQRSLWERVKRLPAVAGSRRRKSSAFIGLKSSVSAVFRPRRTSQVRLLDDIVTAVQ